MERAYKSLQRKYRGAKLHYGKGLTEKGVTRKVSEVYVRLMVLERSELKSAFRDRSFGTAAEANRRIEHVFNDLVRGASAGARRPVELSKLFPESSNADDDSFRILLLASAGCGKTTLMTQFCPLKGHSSHKSPIVFLSPTCRLPLKETPWPGLAFRKPSYPAWGAKQTIIAQSTL